MKKVLLLLLILSTAVNGQVKQKSKAINTSGKLAGTITYDLTPLAPTKPDVGATIFIRQSDVIKESAQDVMANYMKAKMYTYLYSVEKNENDYKQLQLLNAETKEKLDALDNTTAEFLAKFKKDPKTIMITTDQDGNYSVNLKSGRYEIIICSNNKSNKKSVTELNGMVYSYFIDIKANETTNRNHRFK